MPPLCDFSNLNRSNCVGLWIVEQARFSILAKTLSSLRTNGKISWQIDGVMIRPFSVFLAEFKIGFSDYF
jgi:hypothetical protein